MQREQWLSYKPGNSASVTLTDGETINISSWNYNAVSAAVTTNVYGHMIQAANDDIIFNNGGNTYISSNDGVSFASNALSVLGQSYDGYRISNDTLFLMTQSGVNEYLYRSTNNGSSWTQETSSTGEIWGMAELPDGTLFTGIGNTVQKSTDNGDNWASVFTGLTASNIKSVDVLENNTTLVACGLDKTTPTNNVRVYVSKDSGVTWDLSQIITNAASVSTSTIRTYQTGSRVYIFTTGSALKINIYYWEDDKVYPYTQANIGTSLNAGIDANGNIWYMQCNDNAGTNHELLKSVDSGISWVSLDSLVLGGASDIFHDVFVTSEGTILYSLDNDIYRLPQDTI